MSGAPVYASRIRLSACLIGRDGLQRGKKLLTIDRHPINTFAPPRKKAARARRNATNLSRENFLNFTIFNSSPVIIGINLIYDFSLFSFFNDLTFVKLMLIKMAKNRIKVGTRLFIHRCEQVCEGGSVTAALTRSI